ncbi:hypothetical protein BH23THE1_BH23THE1_13420 [soil metagenome]
MNSIILFIWNYLKMFQKSSHIRGLTKKHTNTSKDLREIHLPYTPKIYYSKENDVFTRFDNAYFLYLEQKIKDQKYRDKEDLK